MAKTLYKKILEIQTAVSGLSKDKTGNSYTYVSGDKILKIIRPLMDTLGILLIPEIEDSSFTRQDYSLVNNKGEVRPKSEIFCALKMKFTWVDTDTGDTLVCHWASSGQNNWDKSLGSAITYGERYFLLKFFHVATDKDDVDAPRTIEEEMTLQQVLAWIPTLKTQEEMNNAWATYSPYYKDNKAFKATFAKRQKEISDGIATQ